MPAAKRYLITSALPYANGPLHIGHIAGAYLPADIFARYLRQKKCDVVYVCGSDEHGAAITIRAKMEGVTPQQVIDKYHDINARTFSEFGISFDIYHRTSSLLHHETAQEFFADLEKKGAFVKKDSAQFFDEGYQQFLADRYVTGTCPNCGHDKAYGDQCEKCGTSLNPEDLINPVSVLSGKPPVKKQTSHWYLPMGKEESWLREWISNGTLNGTPHHDPLLWKKHVVGQCLSWIDGKLGDRAITRDLDWGVKVPLEDTEGKVLYVWLDAPIGYISATKQWALDHKTDWKKYWQNEETQLVHFIGKDNIVFHCIIFPIILKLKGNYNLPVNIPANEFLNLEGQKLSTSRNWAVWLQDYLREFPEKQDELRYVLTSIAPEAKDSEFTWKDYQARINNELVAILGNFVNRCMVLTQKYFEGKIPAAGVLTGIDRTILAELGKTRAEMERNIELFRFREGLTALMNLARAGNKYLADEEPWKKIKEDEDRVKTVLHIALQITAGLAVLMEPFLPFTAGRLKAMIGEFEGEWNDVDSGALLATGHSLLPASLLFEKVENDAIDIQIARLKEKTITPEGSAKKEKPMIDFESFARLDLRVASVIEAEKPEGSKKLLKLKVDLGDETRIVLSGIAEHYSPQEVVGKQVVMLTNLAPRKMMGIESQGMILMANGSDGKPVLLHPAEVTGNGAAIS